MLLRILKYGIAAFIIHFFMIQALFAQEGFIIDSVEFCAQKIPVPDTCIANTKHQVSGKDWSINWSEVAPALPGNSFKAFAKAMQYTLIAQKIKFIIHGQNADGAIMKNELKESYMVYAFAKIDKQSIIVILSLINRPVDNNSIPGFAKQIIRFKQ